MPPPPPSAVPLPRFAGEEPTRRRGERKTAEGGTIAVYTDITGIKRAEEELHDANRKAELANALLQVRTGLW